MNNLVKVITSKYLFFSVVLIVLAFFTNKFINLATTDSEFELYGNSSTVSICLSGERYNQLLLNEDRIDPETNEIFINQETLNEYRDVLSYKPSGFYIYRY